MKYLLNTVETYRVDTVSEVEQLHQAFKDDTRFILKSFEYKTKDIKEKGEIVGEYQIVKVKKEFNIEKDPISDVLVSYEVD